MIVSKDCLISYKGNQYSTPYRFACQRVKVRETNEAILEIYDEFECVARHPMVDVFCKRKVQRIATKNTECCHPIISLFSRKCICQTEALTRVGNNVGVMNQTIHQSCR
ncbi:Mu transposase domain-containing protein [Solibacillus silvestris]